MAESRAETNVRDIDNMPAEFADRLEEAGYDDLDSVVNASVEDLMAIPGVDEDMASQILEIARKHEEIEEEEPQSDESDEDGEDAEAMAEEGDEEAVAETEEDQQQEEAKVE